MADIRFDGKVAIVTGAGGGLGRAHALEFARRGAKVVVNDLGGALDGTGGSSEAALKVVEEIRAAGGEAIANGASVTDDAGVAGMVKQTMDAWGRIDILIANAGILRDRSFSKMTIEDFEFVLDVHLMGTVKCAKGVWDIMRAQKYGRIITTTSPTGLYGNFGQTNYGAAKAGLVGLMKSLKQEGERDNIRVNTICPIAASRMTETIMPPEILKRIGPEYVSPVVAYLCSEDAPTGMLVTTSAGVVSIAKLYETEGVFLDHISAEAVRDNWAKVIDTTGQEAYDNGGGQVQKFFRHMGQG